MNETGNAMRDAKPIRHEVLLADIQAQLDESPSNDGARAIVGALGVVALELHEMNAALSSIMNDVKSITKTLNERE